MTLDGVRASDRSDPQAFECLGVRMGREPQVGANLDGTGLPYRFVTVSHYLTYPQKGNRAIGLLACNDD